MNNTARALFSCGAVHWDPEGPAAMLPRVAGANCCPKPSLVYLTDGQLADSPKHIGPLLKFLIKFEGIRPEPRIKQFLENYINPERSATLLAPIKAKDGIQPKDCIEHKQGVITGLEYLLNHLKIRTIKTIGYILNKKLLILLFAIPPEDYQSCEKYFTDHFMRHDDPKAFSKISSPGFLAIFFLGIFIDQPESARKSVFDILEAAKNTCAKMPSLSSIIHNTILILNSFPTTTAALAKSSIPTTPSERFIEKFLKDIFELWHANKQTKQGVSYQPLWFNTPPVSSELTLEREPNPF